MDASEREQFMMLRGRLEVAEASARWLSLRVGEAERDYLLATVDIRRMREMFDLVREYLPDDIKATWDEIQEMRDKRSQMARLTPPADTPAIQSAPS